jgi:hypothetical protein
MMLGGIANANEERKKEELQKQQQQAALMSAYQVGQAPGGSDPASVMAALSQAVPGLEAKDLVAMQQAGMQTSEASANIAQKKAAVEKRQQGIETLTQIANRSDTNNPNVQKAMRQVALNYGLSKEDLAMVIPESGGVTRATTTVDVNGVPTVMNVVYDKATGQVIGREAVGPAVVRDPITVNTNIDLGNKKFQEKIGEADAQEVTAGRVAQQALPGIAEARKLAAESPEIFGAGATVFSDMRRGSLAVLDVMGVSPNDPAYAKISNQESGVALSRTLTQEFVRPRMEATKGAISDREFATFMESVPNLLQTPEGYIRVLDYMENAINAQILYAEALENAYDPESNLTPPQFRREWNKFSTELPMGAFNRDELESMWSKYQADGNMSKVTFMVSNNAGEARVVSFEDIKKDARELGLNTNTLVNKLKSDGVLSLFR